MAQYRLSRQAAADLRGIALFGLEQFGREQARRYRDALLARFDQIATQPSLYPAVDYIRPGLRRSVIASHSIYYIIDDGPSVLIVRIIGRQEFSLEPSPE